ncbi:histone deacetylase family protein [Teladorsagia circumcincta]|uniref:histone deacetylase n=1 Tax=Teladorsagia circumcincta TaxID=45464 RepID=A0A2G9UWH9_TELCI|nr:histone deacetylase family protein [Teladorsagia circumcincta]
MQRNRSSEHRNASTNSSSTTISQHTKDRLKNMIAQRNREGSQTNLAGTPPQQHAPMSPQINVSSPHFEPYRVPASLHSVQAVSCQPSGEYQLRKVNSEPNLKMRIRAKLLSKGSSPVQNQNSFSFTHPQLKRSDSETSGNGSSTGGGTLAMDALLSNAAATAFPPHLIMPSPSLPNLAAPTLAQPPQLPIGDLPSGRATGLAYDSSMARHECVCGESSSHVEHGGRVQSIWARLLERGLVQRCERIAAKKASLEQLRMVHSPTYVTFFAVSPTACLKMEASQLPLKSFVQLPCGGIGIDSDTYFNDATTQTAARVAAGSLIELASQDVHHGNGTQLCFEEDPSVLYLSLHRHDNGNFFPGTGAVTEVGRGAGKGFSVNVPFSGGVMRDADYLAAWRVVVHPVLEQFQPNFILVSAGFDACCGHPNALGGYKISAEMFGFMTRQLMGFAGGRVVLALEGGYDLASISDAAEQCVKVLCGDDDKAGILNSEALEGIPCLSAQETIQKVIAIHKGYWPNLTAEQGLSISELHWQTVGRQFQNLTMGTV